MGALAGFICGYYLGVKAGPEGFDEMRRAVEELAQSRELQALLGSLQMGIQNAVPGAGGPTPGGAPAGPNLGKLAEALGAITQSTEFQAFLGSGAAMLGRVMEQGRRANGS